ncbi:MAG: hypothetical protein FWC39_13780 [Bacteroidetes bacterium]|nr:hypothetical protein [Bacteroidota bacterium]
MPAESFVGIWKFVARPNLCGTPACVKPPPRWAQAGDRAVQTARVPKC